jgi:putative Mg2+ transporter-C (MgtC) family protein
MGGWEHLDVNFWSKVLAAVGCGLLLGFERQIRGKPAGMRTSTLICLGSMLFIHITAIAANASGMDIYRVVGQVVTGIGFLGGGVIVTNGGLVHGVTSAAVIWLLSGIGVAIGLGYFALAIGTTMTGILVLVGVEQLENGFKALRRGVHAHLEDKNRSD